MSFSLTSLSYLIGLIVLAYYSYRIFSYWQRNQDFISKLWFFVTLFFSLFFLIRFFGLLFILDNPELVQKTLAPGVFFQFIGISVMAYIIFYLKFQKISPWIGFFTIFLIGLVISFFSISVEYSPVLVQGLSIDWGFVADSLFMITVTVRSFIFLVLFVPLTLIFIEQYKQSEDVQLKKRNFGLVLTFIFLIITAISDLFFINFLGVSPVWRDISLVCAGILFLIALIQGKRI